MDHVRRRERKESRDLSWIGDVGLDEAHRRQLIRRQQSAQAAVVANGVDGDHLGALADQLPDGPGADATVSTGYEKSLAHAATTGLLNVETPSTSISTTSPAASGTGGSRK